jgi:transcriptional regulator with XRE-family HTH domain
MDKQSIGRAIRKKRLQKGLTQRQVAAACGVKPSYIARIENGRANFTISKLLSIAAVLQVPPYGLFDTKPLVPYRQKPPRLVFDAPEGNYTTVKLFPDAGILAPGYEIGELIPLDYVPVHKDLLPAPAGPDKDRMVAVLAADNGMAPVINRGSVMGIDRLDVEPRVGEIFAFLLRDAPNAVTVKRLTKVDRHHLIIDGDNQSPAVRKSGELKDYPMLLSLKRSEHDEAPLIRGRVLWALNRLA